MLLLLALFGGAIATIVVLRVCRSSFSGPNYVLSNFRGRTVRRVGVALVGTIIPAVALDPRASYSAIAVAAMCFLGHLDDLKGDRDAGGFRGHLRAASKGKLTTGLVKAVGGGVVGLGYVYSLGHRGLALFALAVGFALLTNVFNLLDFRPGRALKVFFASTLPLLGPGAPFVLVAAQGGAAWIFVQDLREEVMLGDAGANFIGAVVAVAAVSAGSSLRLAFLLSAAGITLLSEMTSIDGIIKRVPPLAFLDRLGRLP